ncbi:MAG: hypothetical protein Q9176_004605 [Flavoplaca citrina]
MPLEWRTRKAPPIGLRAQKLPYGHLHEHCGGDFDAEREKAETDIYGPPLSDSDEKSPSLPPSPKPKPEYPPPSKRRRLDTRSSQQSDPTSSPSVKKEQYPADIPRTAFTPSTPSSCHHLGSTENKAPSSSLDSRTAIKDEAEDLFPEYTASQSKASKTYQRNFHKAAPVRPEQKQRVAEQEKTESMVKSQPDGFKIPDTEALIALGMGSLRSHQWFTLMLRKFDPLKKGVRRPNSSNQLDHPQAQDRRGREDVQQTKNPTVKGQLVRKPLRGHHKHRALPSENLPHGHSSKCQKDRSSHGASMPDAPIVPGLAGLQGFANEVANQAKIKLEFSAPESSATTSSGPTFDFDVGDGNSSSSLSSAPDVEELDAIDYQDEVLKAQRSSSPKSKCPLCKRSVSRLFLDEFSSTGFLNLRQQAKFCKAHNIHSAREMWRERGYPSLEWQELQARLPTYGDDLVGVLNNTRTSFYRNVLDEQVKSGKRTAKQLMMVGADDREGSKMGYYGTKGQRILMDYLMERFASRIRRLAGTDRLVSASGVAGYVQGVLVPELAVMLVKDDMRVDDEQARVILKESTDIGNLLNEEEDEVIKDEVEEDG